MQTENLNVFTLETLIAAIAVAESRYIATAPTDKAGNVLTASADLRKGRKFLTVETVAHAASLLDKSKIDGNAVLTSIGSAMPVKAVMRMCEFFAALHAKNYQQLDAVTVLSILSNAYAGAKSRDALMFATTGKGDENTSDVVQVENVRKLQRVMKKVGATTAPTQISRSFGKAGFCGALGIGRIVRDEKSGQRELVEVSKSNAFFRAVYQMVNDASENTLSLMRGAKGNADKGSE